MATNTTIPEKVLASVVNACFGLLLSLPFLVILGPSFFWKFLVILIFFLYEIFSYFLKDHRDLGMLIARSQWKDTYNFSRFFVYSIFYTLSFATLFMKIWFLFDVFLLNLLLIQLPFIKFTGRTLHGFIAQMSTVKMA